MIRYPYLPDGAIIGITAPSSGVQTELHEMLKQSISRIGERGFQTIIGETVWTQDKAKSAPAPVRARELNEMMQDAKVDLLFPPWGGELLIEILEYTDFERFQPKWILGYSDTSVLLLALTLKIVFHSVGLVKWKTHGVGSSEGDREASLNDHS